MRITWNPSFKQFEALLTPGEYWISDQQAVKAAGFKTEGPPEWRWIAFRAGVLTKLRSARPVSGLTISPDALDHYTRLKSQEDMNAAVLRQLKEAKQAQKAADLEAAPGIDWDAIEPEERIYVRYAPPALPSTLCQICRTPVYYYESQDPPLCLDCEFADEF